MSSLLIAIEQMNLSKRQYQAGCEDVWKALFAAYPEISVVLEEWAMPKEIAGPSFCEPLFDDAKSAAELFAEGRGAEVLRRIRQTAHGVYQ